MGVSKAKPKTDASSTKKSLESSYYKGYADGLEAGIIDRNAYEDLMKWHWEDLGTYVLSALVAAAGLFLVVFLAWHFIHWASDHTADINNVSAYHGTNCLPYLDGHKECQAY